MKLPPFALASPTTVEEAVACLVEVGDDATMLAGGQSLVPLMALRLATPAVLVDLAGLPELDSVEATSDGGVAIGAMARQRTVERHPVIAARAPLTSLAVAHIGHAAIRNRGTVGGSLAHADPAAELPTVAVASDAVMIAAGPGGTRAIPAAEFFAGYMTTTLTAEEVLVEMRLPPLEPHTGVAFEEFSRRHGDFALAAVAAVLTVGASGTIDRARLALAAVGSTPIRAHTAEAVLLGAAATDDVFTDAAAAAATEADPVGDLHATAAYRRHLVGVLVRRALAAAAQRARSAQEARDGDVNR